MAQDKKEPDDNEELPQPPEETDASQEENGEGPDVALPEDDGNALRNFFADCFVQYASYVVRDRAIPDVDDGLKPVQRRILHCMYQVDDGRYNKVAGVVGDTMHYHPHGDASIAGALTVLANKEYFIDRQGNFGNILTGMPAAAPRYIECRLTELAKETLFNPEITEFVDTYDGRLKEPVCLPSKVPSLLMLGSDGIAVGMSTHIFSHNFGELLEAEIKILRGEPFAVYPDFPQGSLMDVSEYEDGAGKIRVRARIEADGDKKLIIREVPPGSTTDSLLASIEAAAKKNKVKLTSINDYTAETVCIEIALQRGIYAEETIQELYAYTDCEKELFSDLLVIKDNVPVKMTVSEILRRNVEKLKEYLRRELELAILKLAEKALEKTLAQIFVENRIYKRIEKCSTVEAIFAETNKGLAPYVKQFYRPITDEDIEKLLQIPIRRISAFDIAKNEQEVAELNAEKQLKEEQLAHLVEYAIQTLQHISDKYAKHFPRKTEIVGFNTVNVKAIARKDVKVYFDRQAHFVGTNVKPSNKETPPLVVTEYDKLVTLRGDGTCKVIDIPEKEYVGQTKYLFPFNKEQVYCILYRDRIQGTWYAKRFKLGQYILNKEYHIVPPNCLIEQLYTNSGVKVQLELSSKTRRTLRPLEVDFDELALRSREAKGFKLTSYAVSGIKVISKGGESPAENSQASEETAAKETGEQEASADVMTLEETPKRPVQEQLFEMPPLEEEKSVPPVKKTPVKKNEKKGTDKGKLTQGSFFFDEDK